MMVNDNILTDFFFYHIIVLLLAQMSFRKEIFHFKLDKIPKVNTISSGLFPFKHLYAMFALALVDITDNPGSTIRYVDIFARVFGIIYILNKQR